MPAALIFGSRTIALGSSPRSMRSRSSRKRLRIMITPRSLGPRCSLRAVGDRALTDPRDEVLVHDVGRDPAAGQRVLDRPVPRRDTLLHVRLALLRHAA